MSRFNRIIVFLNYMFPPAIYVPGGVITFFAGYLGAYAISGLEEFTFFSGPVFVGIITTILFGLLMRVYDELKDVETDLRLGKQGDPRFKDRPIVTGAVLKEDIVFLRWLVTAVLVVFNLFLINTPAFYPFILLFVVGWLSFKWFFVPAISKNLLLALVTHNPIAILQMVYILSIFATIEGFERLAFSNIFLIIGLWLPVAAWETSRKIRLPEDETEYQTYSSMLGWKKAVLLPFIFNMISTLSLCMLVLNGYLPVWFAYLVGFTTLIMASRCILLWVAPTSARTNLRPYAEAYVLVVNFGLIVASLVAV